MLRPDNDRGRPGEKAASNVTIANTPILPDFEHFARRLIAEATSAASRAWWLNRAEDFERAKPIPGDFHGNATREQLSFRWRWCHATAQACRNKAALIAMTAEDFHAELSDMLDREAGAA